MANENIKIMNWKNGLLLSTVSYMLYLILWFILDDETAGQLPEMAIADYIIDYLLCMLFTYISLGFSFLVFRVLPFRTSYVWVIVYASCLFTLNNVVAFGMISLFNFLWGENGNGLLDELLNMKGAYTFAMISTFLSSVYANTFYLQSYIKARNEKQALEMALMKEKEIALQSQLNSLKLQINPHFMFNNFNNLLELIAADSAFNMSLEDLQRAMEPSRYIGRSREQVESFLAKVIGPVLTENKDLLGVKAEINV